MRGLLFTLMLGAGAAASAGTVYKWVDPNGVTHYSDTPVPGAEKVQVGPVQTYQATPAAAGGAAAPAQPAGGPQPAPVCVIDSPADDQVFENTFDVQGHVSLSPPPQPDQQVVLRMDGRTYTGVVDGGGSFALNSVDRGSHSLTVQVQDEDGQALCTSAAVTFHVHQASVNGPLNNPGVPRPPRPSH